MIANTRRFVKWALCLTLWLHILPVHLAVRPTTVSLTTLIKEQVYCSAQIEPKDFLVKQFESGHSQSLQTIRCSALLGESSHNKDAFTRPVFDLSFGLTPITGIFIVRGNSQCSEDNTKCWSDFQIKTQALRQLVLPSNSDQTASPSTEQSSVTHLPSSIDFTCNVADTSRNTSMAIRCSDSGSIRFATVLKYGDQCSKTSLHDECGQNMHCGNLATSGTNNCVCKEPFLAYPLSRDEVICVEQATLGSKCNFTQQCTKNVHDSLCEFDATLGFRICKCLSGFEEVRISDNQTTCSKIKPKAQYKPNENSNAEVDVSLLANNNSTTLDKYSQTSDSHDKKCDTGMVNKDIPQQEYKGISLGNLNKSSQLGLIAFSAVLLVAIVIGAIIARSRKQGTMKMKSAIQSNAEAECDDSGKQKGPLLGAIHSLSEDEEEVEIAIDEEVNDTRPLSSGNSGQSMVHPSEMDSESSATSNMNNNNNGVSFNFSAKQSIV